MGYKAAVQILKQAEDLKDKVLRKTDLLIDSQAWIHQQSLQTIYHQVLILDLEYALDKKVEQDLWTIGFKNHISILQELTRNKKNLRRSECQALLTWCLEAASGFYLTLLQELCNTFDIDLPFRRRGNVYGQTNLQLDLNLPQSSSCSYICQYCLVHLGDIARYRNQRRQAENFYKQAIMVSPTSGQPYNQLALLEASQGDKLSTVFYYIRSIAVKNPFPAATTNLLNTLNSTVDKDSPLEKIQAKVTASEFIQIFLCAHALLHTATDLDQAEICVKTLTTTMTALVATQSFTTDKLIKITAINFYALKHVTLTNSTDELTEDEKIVRQHVLDLLAGSLSAFLVPVHTLKNEETLLDYYALPAVKMLMDWIRHDSKVLTEGVFTNRLQIWPSLCKLLNNVQIYTKDLDYKKYTNTPLPEDRVLQGFKPLIKCFKELDFKAEEIEDRKTEKLVRMKRIIDFGLFITELNVNNTKLMIKTEANSEFTFEPGCIQPDPTNDLLEEMKSFNVTDLLPITTKSRLERRGGILKPQGSLEKSREERELLSSTDSSLILESNNASLTPSFNDIKKEVKVKRSKQNVAIQSIFKKIEENKQVKFNVEDIKDAATYDSLTKSVPSPPASQYNLPHRTQSFNQNHPAFPIPPKQPDYLSSLRSMSMPPPPTPPNNFTYPKNEVSNPPPPSMHYPPSSQSVFGNTSNIKTGYGTSALPANFNPRVMPPYTNIPLPRNQSFGIKMDDPPPNSPWWPNSNFQRPDNLQMNYPFNSNLPYTQPSDYNKSQNQAAGDMFSPSWGPFSRPNVENYNSGVSMRQAMLKEAHNSGRQLPDTLMQGSSPGYSLFNTNSWTPNLVGQLGNTKPQDSSMGQLPQHSLFTGQGPQSLAQLLEQQQSQKTDP